MNPADVLSATIFTSGWTYVFFGLFGLWKRKRALGMTAEAVGKVTTRAKWWDIEDPQVKVEFRAKTGEMVTFSTDQRRYQIGDSVDVIYDPADCKYARVNDGNPVHPQVQLVVFVLLILIGLGWEVFRWSHDDAQRDQQVQSYSQKVEAYHQRVEAYYQRAEAWNAKCLAFVGRSTADPIAKQCHEELQAIIAKANADGLHIDVTKVEAYNQKIEAWNAKCLAFVGTSPADPIPKQCEDERNVLVARAKPDGWLIDKRK